MTLLGRLQSWFHDECDGDWEHGSGIVISTIDNPGWSASITVRGTSLENRPLAAVKLNRTENDWLWMWRTEASFEIRCGPQNLEEAVAVFCDWAEAIDEMPQEGQD
jgi:hypothetical protein